MITFIESGNRIATENFEIGEIYTITYTNETIRTMCCIGIGSDFVMFQDKLPSALFCLTLGTAETVSSIDIGGGGGITMNYNELENKPQINGIVLIGNKTSSDLGLLSQADLDNYVTDIELTTAIAGKQDTLTTPQLTAVNSGITSSLVTQIGRNTVAIADKQDTLTTPQLTAVNSGITSSLVTQIGRNTDAIADKQDTLTTPQLTAVNSGITNSLVNQITTNKNNISKYQVKTLNVNFNDLTFTRSIEGMYYSNEIAISGLTMVLSVMITGFVDIKDTDVITPILTNDGSKLRFISNVSTFSTSARYSLQIFGINDA